MEALVIGAGVMFFSLSRRVDVDEEQPATASPPSTLSPSSSSSSSSSSLVPPPPPPPPPSPSSSSSASNQQTDNQTAAADERRRALVDCCVARLSCQEAYETAGIFRVSGNGSRVSALLAAHRSAENGSPIDVSGEDVHTVTSLLLRWFGELDEPLVSAPCLLQLRQLMADTGPASTQPPLPSPFVDAATSWWQTLTPFARHVLAAFFALLARVAEHQQRNQMTPHNLARIASSVFWELDQSPAAQLQHTVIYIKFVELLLANAAQFDFLTVCPSSQ